MSRLLDALASLALAVWLGAMLFFAAGVAPAAFGVLPDRVLAGNVVSASMRTLHLIVYACAGVAGLALTWRAFIAKGRWGKPMLAVVLVMGAIALYSGLVVGPELGEIRQTVGAIDALAPGDPVRQRFDYLHRLSVRLMSVNLLAAIGLVVAESLRKPTP